MNYDMLVNIVSHLRPGVFTRLTYKTDLPMKAEYKKQGYQISGVRSTTVRFGVEYGNIAHVISRREEASTEPRDNVRNRIHAVIPKYIYKHEESGQIYLRAFPCVKGTNTHSSFVVKKYNDDGNLDSYVEYDNLPSEYKYMVRESYWNSKKSFSPIFTVKLENILKINNIG